MQCRDDPSEARRRLSRHSDGKATLFSPKKQPDELSALFFKWNRVLAYHLSLENGSPVQSYFTTKHKTESWTVPMKMSTLLTGNVSQWSVYNAPTSSSPSAKLTGGGNLEKQSTSSSLFHFFFVYSQSRSFLEQLIFLFFYFNLFRSNHFYLIFLVYFFHGTTPAFGYAYPVHLFPTTRTHTHSTPLQCSSTHSCDANRTGAMKRWRAIAENTLRRC